MSSSKNQGKRDKGKGVQKAEYYQLQVPTKNQFLPLSNFPPLPYKSVVTLPPSSPGQNNSYVPRHIEHLFLMSFKTIPNTNVTASIIQKTFGNKHFVINDPRHSQQFYELILVENKSIMITHTPDKFNLGQFLYLKCVIKNVLVLNNGRIHLKKRNFPSNMTRKPTITMTTGMLGIEPFSITLRYTHDFSIFMSIVLPIFPSSFTTGGHGLEDLLPSCPIKQKKVGNVGSKRRSPWNPTCAQYNFSNNSILHGFCVGSIGYISISRITFHFL